MSHPDHKDQLPNLKRIEGQSRGIRKMNEEEKYSNHIHNQIKAVKNALSTVEGKILKTHLQACVRDTLSSDKKFDEKVDEILKTLKR